MASGGRLRPAMDGDAGFPPAPLKIETQLEPGELTRTRAGPGFGVCNVYIPLPASILLGSRPLSPPLSTGPFMKLYYYIIILFFATYIHPTQL